MLSVSHPLRCNIEVFHRIIFYRKVACYNVEMQLKEILKDYKVQPKSGFKKITNERQIVVKDFYDILEGERRLSNHKRFCQSKGRFVPPKYIKQEEWNTFKKTKQYLKHKPASFYAIKMSHLSVPTLKRFFVDCRRAKQFSQYWWWSLKVVDKSLDQKDVKSV